MRPIQIFNRLYRKLNYTPRLRNIQISKSVPKAEWIRCEFLASSYRDGQFSFLNEVSNLTHWNDENQSKLWLYNLHYFDDLNALGAIERQVIHVNLINKWVAENPVGVGNGWEPYPSSLRIVNWIKYFLCFDLPTSGYDESLYQQAHYLRHNIEYHLLGNHLFENGKALVFAGCYFDDLRSKEWLLKGLRILDREIPEQISEDGSNFELSPMYHNIILADMLDLYNLALTFGHEELLARKGYWKQLIKKMLCYSSSMNHPDGDVSSFNDSATGVSGRTSDLVEYAGKLDITYQRCEELVDTLCYKHYSDAGYVVVNAKNLKAILDVAKIGPDYIPGHGHADTLSFEASLYGYRVFVNSGTGVYGVSEERLNQRKTAAHNTVEVDGFDSSEVWGGFRVARRANPTLKSIQQGKSSLLVSASHDGYKRLKGKVIHHREWSFSASELSITDRLLGEVESAFAFLHIHPDIMVTSSTHNVLLTLPNSRKVIIESDCRVKVLDSMWYPEFGKSIRNKKLIYPIANQSLTITVKY
ncbi:alginate lyase family protein [Vibrio sp. 10N.261.55.A7]|uniref:heparinase II/III family protein n=1 Tax=Vibrio sp. 10N.261.55.A7 TaxID=1880851 RepID=UPI001F5302C1|nr:alginate lyase family protein [Vibrio sp. 10N.261.55.A7]